MNFLQFLYSYILPVCCVLTIFGLALPFALPFAIVLTYGCDLAFDIRNGNGSKWFKLKFDDYLMNPSHILLDFSCLVITICPVIMVILLILGVVYDLKRPGE